MYLIDNTKVTNTLQRAMTIRTPFPTKYFSTLHPVKCGANILLSAVLSWTSQLVYMIVWSPVTYPYTTRSDLAITCERWTSLIWCTHWQLYSSASLIWIDTITVVRLSHTWRQSHSRYRRYRPVRHRRTLHILGKVRVLQLTVWQYNTIFVY
jgi:hypothetical protein